MVQIYGSTPEEILAASRPAAPDELTQIDRDVIGETCRIQIPFRDVVKMRYVAEQLRAYADQLDFYSRRTDMPARSILFHLRTEARMLNRRIQDHKGPGRPRRDRESN